MKWFARLIDRIWRLSFEKQEKSVCMANITLQNMARLDDFNRIRIRQPKSRQHNDNTHSTQTNHFKVNVFSIATTFTTATNRTRLTLVNKLKPFK